MQQLVPKIHPFGATVLNNKITPGGVITVAAHLAEYIISTQEQQEQQQAEEQEDNVESLSSQQQQQDQPSYEPIEAHNSSSNATTVLQPRSSPNNGKNNNHQQSTLPAAINNYHHPGGGGGVTPLPPIIPSIDTNVNVNHASHARQPLSKQAQQQQRKLKKSPHVHYTVWITTAWNILGWSEPTASIFWEIATMFHNLHNAGRNAGGGDDSNADNVSSAFLSNGHSNSNSNHANPAGATSSNSNMFMMMSSHLLHHGSSSSSYIIPPILPCGSNMSDKSFGSDRGSVSSYNTHNTLSSNRTTSLDGVFRSSSSGTPYKSSKANATTLTMAQKSPASSARELPVWLICLLLLMHADGNTNGDALNLLHGHQHHHHTLNMDAMSGADDEAQLLIRASRFMLRNMRLFLLLIADPRDILVQEAIRMFLENEDLLLHVNSNSAASSMAVVDSGELLAGIGPDVDISFFELERLSFVLQHPFGGNMEDTPLDVAQYFIPGGNSISNSRRINRHEKVSIVHVEAELRKHLGRTMDALFGTATLPSEQRSSSVQMNGNGNSSFSPRRSPSNSLHQEMSQLSIKDASNNPNISPTSTSIAASISNANLHLNLRRTMSLQSNVSDATAGSRDSQRGVSGNPNMEFKELSYSNCNRTTILLRPYDENSPYPNDSDGSTDRNNASHNSGGSSSMRLHDLSITSCSDVHMYLLQPFEHATISGCQNCTIVIGAVAGLLHVADCDRVNITSASRRIIVRNSHDVKNFCYTPSSPLLVGEVRSCQFAPYNTYYEGLREDLLATGLAQVNVSTHLMLDMSMTQTPVQLPLQCPSNKWKLVVEPSSLETPISSLMTMHVPSSGGGVLSSNNRNLEVVSDDTVHTPIQLPASEFYVLFIPLGSSSSSSDADKENSSQVGSEDEYGSVSQHDNRSDRSVSSDEIAPKKGSRYSRALSDMLQSSPFKLPFEYERRCTMGIDRVRNMQQSMYNKELTAEQRIEVEEELNRGFRDWLVTSGNLRQVLDLVNMEEDKEQSQTQHQRR